MSKIRLVGIFDNSGYGYANKKTFNALLKTGRNVTTQIINTPMSRSEMAQDIDYKTIVEHSVKKDKPDTIIAQLVPFMVDHFFQKDTRNILSFFWESDRICQNWVSVANNGLTSEVWTPCQSNYDALINSGITKPVYIVPQFIDTTIIKKDIAENILPIIGNKDAYRFYSIFQWSERKNPEGLLRAYYNEFTAADNVMFVIKTYGPSPFADRRRIKETILKIKDDSDNNNPPPVFYLGELLTSEQVDSIAPQCHCYVHAGRGEGLNIPLVNAMAYKQQVITTKLGGIVDWMDDGSAYIIPHTLEDIDTTKQAWGAFYQSTPPQKWGRIEDKDIQVAMRKAYNERNDYSDRVKKYDGVLKYCSEEYVVEKIKERLNE